MTKPRITVFFDYVCPFCLLAENAIVEVAQENGLEIEWKPFELRPQPTPTLRPEDDYLPNIWNRAVYPMARGMGIPIKLPTISPQPYSHTAFEGLIYAREHGQEDEYNARVLRAFFQEDKDIGDLDVLTEIAGELGLDQAEFRTALTDRRHKDEHQAALAEARAAHIESVPTVIVGEYRIAGVPNREQMTGLVRKAMGAPTVDVK